MAATLKESAEDGDSTWSDFALVARDLARIVDYSVEAPELVDFVGKCSCPRDGGEVPGDNSSSPGCRRERFATSTLVSPVQYDLMALVDQEPGRHKTEAIR